MGSAAELVDNGRTGLLFEPGNADDLAAKVRQIAAAGGMEIAMRQAVRREFEEKYTPESNYAQLMEIYRRAGTKTSADVTASCQPAVPSPHHCRSCVQTDSL
jgi:glycosyltransferase involved in cell wall biosynthesis